MSVEETSEMVEKDAKPKEYPQVGVASTSRDYTEYVAMFRLTEDDLRAGPILDVAGGGSSFTSHMREMGLRAIAADPFFAGKREDVLAAAKQEIEVSSAKIAANAGAFDWSFYSSPEKHRELREKSFAQFSADFMRDDANERYIPASLPRLPFEDGSFELVLCSHFLFLYGADSAFDEAFHLAAMTELLRVVRPGGQVRIYPLVTLKWESYPSLPHLLEQLMEIADAETMETGLPFTPVQSPILKLTKRS